MTTAHVHPVANRPTLMIAAVTVMVVQVLVLLVLGPAVQLGLDGLARRIGDSSTQFSFAVFAAAWVVTGLATAHLTARQARIDADASGSVRAQRGDHERPWGAIDLVAVIGATGTLGTLLAMFQAMLLTPYSPFTFDQPPLLWLAMVTTAVIGPIAAAIALVAGAVRARRDRHVHPTYRDDAIAPLRTSVVGRRIHGPEFR